MKNYDINPSLRNSRISEWHFPMLNDNKRNEIYFQALRSYITEDTVVLDIGAGSGLLSMMAAKLGAKHVFAIESNANLAKCMKKIIAKNNLNKKITIINKNSHLIKLRTDISHKADLIITEIFDCGLIGEGCLKTLSHARKNLLKPGGLILPKKAKILATAIELPKIRKKYMIANKISDFDLSNFNEYFRNQGEAIKITNFGKYKQLSSVQEKININFNDNFSTSIKKDFNFKIDSDGYVDCIAIWFRLYFTDDIILENHPFNNLHWDQWVLFPQKSIKVTRGDAVQIKATNYNGHIDASHWRITPHCAK